MNIGHTEGTRPPIPRNRRGQFKANQLLRQGFPPQSQRIYTQIKKVANLGGRIHTPKRPSVWNGSNKAKGGVATQPNTTEAAQRQSLHADLSHIVFFDVHLPSAARPSAADNEQRTNPEVEPSKISDGPAQAAINDSSRHVLDKRGSMEEVCKITSTAPSRFRSPVQQSKAPPRTTNEKTPIEILGSFLLRFHWSPYFKPTSTDGCVCLARHGSASACYSGAGSAGAAVITRGSGGTKFSL